MWYPSVWFGIFLKQTFMHPLHGQWHHKLYSNQQDLVGIQFLVPSCFRVFKTSSTLYNMNLFWHLFERHKGKACCSPPHPQMLEMLSQISAEMAMEMNPLHSSAAEEEGCDGQSLGQHDRTARLTQQGSFGEKIEVCFSIKWSYKSW